MNRGIMEVLAEGGPQVIPCVLFKHLIKTEEIMD